MRSASVIGLGRVGLALALSLVSRGIRVIGVERDRARRDMIAQGHLDSHEPGLPELFRAGQSELLLDELPRAVLETDTSFVVVPTPAEPDGRLSNSLLIDVVRGIASVPRASPHLIVIVSTVEPGTCRDVLMPLLPPGTLDLRLCYSPAFVALGEVLNWFNAPEFLIVGADDTRSIDHLVSFYNHIGHDTGRIVCTDTLNAEIAKLALNSFLATKIAFANYVDSLCATLPSANASTVLGIVARDPRVGRGYLRAGTPFDGPCLPRDNRAVIEIARRNGLQSPLIEAVQLSNDHRRAELLARIRARLGPNATVGIVGLSYKPRTDYAETGFGLSLANELLALGHRVIAYDPWAAPDDTRRIRLIPDLDLFARTADLYVMTWLDASLAEKVASLVGSDRLIDPWRNNAL